MCVVSMIADHYWDKWKPIQPGVVPVVPPYTFPPLAPCVPMVPLPILPPPKLPTQEEVDEFYKLLEKAREYDRKNNQPDCQKDERLKEIKDLLEGLGLKIAEL